METAKKRPVEVVIRRKDGTEHRLVRGETAVEAAPQPSRTLTSDEHDETYQTVMECAPYTASFNALLARPPLKEDARQMVALVHHRMHTEGIPLNSETYNLLMRRVVRFTDGSIFTLYEELKREGRQENSSVQPNLETFVLLLRACERSAQYNKAFLLYQQMREYFRLVPDTAMYNTLLGYCAAVRDVAQATFLIEEMKQLNVSRDVNSYNCLMSVMVSSAPYGETMKVFQELLSLNIKLTNRSYNTILNAAARHGDYDRAFQLVEEMKRRGLVPDVETYNYLMSVCEQRLDYVWGTGSYAKEHRRREQIVQGTRAIAELVLTLLREMRCMRVNPDTYTYNKAISTLVLCKDERVFGVFNDMVRDANEWRTADTKTTSVAATTAAAGNAFGGSNGISLSKRKKTHGNEPEPDAGMLLEEALQAEAPDEVGNMRSKAVKPNLETWKEITKACLLFGYVDRARDLYANMRDCSMTLNVPIAHILLQLCATTKNTAWAAALLEELKQLNVLIDTGVMNEYLRVLCAADAADAAFTEFRQMQMGIHLSGAWADTNTSNILLRYAYARPDKQHIAEELYAAMTQPHSTAPANDETYCIRVEAYVANAKVEVETAVSYIEDVVRCHNPQLPAFYHAVLQFLLTRDDARIRSWFDRLGNKETGSCGIAVTPDETCYTLLMEYYLAHDEVAAIHDLYAQLQCSSTLEPNAGIYHVLLEVAQRHDSARATTKLFDQAKVHCVALDVRCYNSMLQTYVKHDESLVFDVLSYMMEQHVAPAESTMAVFLAETNGRRVLMEAMKRGFFYKAPCPVPLEKLLP